MKTTRRKLAAECNRLSSMLEASGHESRRVRAANLKALQEQVQSLMATEAKVREELRAANETIAKQRIEIGDLREQINQMQAKPESAVA